jgi:hypothetical protein
MAHVHEEQQYDVPADEMWARIGDFQGLHTWHPAIESTVSGQDGRARDLHLGDGGVVSETLLEEGERSYSYRIDDSPLPVKDGDYVARISVEERGGGSLVVWQADFTPEGASEDEAVEVIGGIFRAGLGNL